MAALPFAVKLEWLEEAQELVEFMRKKASSSKEGTELLDG
jgi:hypothetical protein